MLEKRIEESYKSLVTEIENTERRCKIDAQRVAKLESIKARGNGRGSNRSGAVSSGSMKSGSNPNLAS